MSGWRIVADPVGENPGKPPGEVDADADDEARRTQGENIGGIVVYLAPLTDDGTGTRERYSWREVTRVAYVREISRHPDTPFSEQLGLEVDKASQAVEALNEFVSRAGELQ